MKNFSSGVNKKSIAGVFVGVLLAMLGVFSFSFSEIKRIERVAVAASHTLSSRNDSGFRVVSNADQLAKAASDVNSGTTSLSIRLTAHIDLSEKIWIPIGTSSRPYSGTFDGNGYSIKNVKIDETVSGAAVGFFGYTNNATIKDLRLINPAIISLGTSSGSQVGALVGSATGTTIAAVGVEKGIIKSTATGTTSSYSVGGIVGVMSGGSIKTSYSSSEISGGSTNGGNGGIVGRTSSNTAPTIEDTYFNGTILTTTGRAGDGGIWGSAVSSPNVKRSYYLYATNSDKSNYSWGRFTNAGSTIKTGGPGSGHSSSGTYNTGITFISNSTTFGHLDVGSNSNWFKMHNSATTNVEIEKMPLLRGVGNKMVVLQNNSADYIENRVLSSGKNIYFNAVNLRETTTSTQNISVSLRVSETGQTWSNYTVRNMVAGSSDSRDVEVTRNSSRQRQLDNLAEAININSTGVERQGYYPVAFNRVNKYYQYDFKAHDLVNTSTPVSANFDVYVADLNDGNTGIITGGANITSGTEYLKNKKVSINNTGSFTIYAKKGTVLYFGANNATGGYHSPQIVPKGASTTNSSKGLNITFNEANDKDVIIENISIAFSEFFELSYPDPYSESSADKLWGYEPNAEYHTSFNKPSNLYVSYSSLSATSNGIKIYKKNTDGTYKEETATSPFAYPVSKGRTFKGWAVGSASGGKISGGVEYGKTDGAQSGAPVALINNLTLAQRDNIRGLLLNSLKQTQNSSVSSSVIKLTYNVLSGTESELPQLYATWENNKNNIAFGGYYLNLKDNWGEENIESLLTGNSNPSTNDFYKLSNDDFYEQIGVSFNYNNDNAFYNVKEGNIIGKSDGGENAKTLGKEIVITRNQTALGIYPYAIIITNESGAFSFKNTTATLSKSHTTQNWNGPNGSTWYLDFGDSDSIHLNHVHESVRFYVLAKRDDTKINVDFNVVHPSGLEKTGLAVTYDILEINGSTILSNQIIKEDLSGGEIAFPTFEPVLVGQKIKITNISVLSSLGFVDTVKERVQPDRRKNPDNSYFYPDMKNELVVNESNGIWILDNLYHVIGGTTGTTTLEKEYDVGVYTKVDYMVADIEVVLAYNGEDGKAYKGANQTDFPRMVLSASNNPDNIANLEVPTALVSNNQNVKGLIAGGKITISLSDIYLYNVIGKASFMIAMQNGDVFDLNQTVTLENVGMQYDKNSQVANTYEIFDFAEYIEIVRDNPAEKFKLLVVFEKEDYTVRLRTVAGEGAFTYQQNQNATIITGVHYDDTSTITAKAKEGYFVKKVTFENIDIYNGGLQEYVSEYSVLLKLSDYKEIVAASTSKEFELKVEFQAYEVVYTVVHHYEDLAGGYENDIVTITGYTGIFGEVVQISPTGDNADKIRNIYGFEYVLELSDVEKILTEDTVFNIYYSRKLYDVKYDKNGGTGADISPHQNIKFGGTITIKENTFEKTGYIFVGWSLTKAGSGDLNYAAGDAITLNSVIVANATSNSEITLFAQWKEKTITATWIVQDSLNDWTKWTNTQGYTVVNNTRITSVLTYDKAYIYVNGKTNNGLLTPQNSDRFVFVGWFVNNQGNALQSSSIVKHEQDIEIYARWTEKPVTILFDAQLNGAVSSFDEKQIVIGNQNDATYGKADYRFGSQGYNGGQKMGLPTLTNHRGFEFLGWQKADGTLITADTPLSFSALPIRLYANWKVLSPVIENDENWTWSGSYNDDLVSLQTLQINLGTHASNAYVSNTNSAITYTFEWFKLVGGQDVSVSGQTSATLSLKNVSDSGRYKVKVTASNSTWGQASAISEYGQVTISEQEIYITPKLTNNKITKVYDAKTNVNDIKVTTVVNGVESISSLIVSVVGHYDNANVSSDKNITYLVTFLEGKNPNNFNVYYVTTSSALQAKATGQELEFSDTTKIGEITQKTLNLEINGSAKATGNPYEIDITNIKITNSDQRNFLIENGHELSGGYRTSGGETGIYRPNQDEFTFIDLLEILNENEQSVKGNYNIVLSGQFELEINDAQLKTFTVTQTVSLDKDATDEAGNHIKSSTSLGSVSVNINGVNITKTGTYSVDGKYVFALFKSDGQVDISVDISLNVGTVILTGQAFNHNDTTANVKNWLKEGSAASNEASLSLSLATLTDGDTFEVYYRNFFVVHYNSLLQSEAAVKNTGYNKQEPVAISHPTFNIDGLTFLGWYDSILYANQIANNFTGIQDINAYAKWQLDDIELELWHKNALLTQNEIVGTYDGNQHIVEAVVTNKDTSANEYVVYDYVWKEGTTQVADDFEYTYKNATARKLVIIEITATINFTTGTPLQKTIIKQFYLEIDRFEVDITVDIEKIYDGTDTLKVGLDEVNYFIYDVNLGNGNTEMLQVYASHNRETVTTVFERLKNINISESYEGFLASNYQVGLQNIRGRINKKVIDFIDIGTKEDNFKVYDVNVLKVVKGIATSDDVVLGQRIEIDFSTNSANAGVYQTSDMIINLNDINIFNLSTPTTQNYDFTNATFVGEAQILKATIDADLIEFEDISSFEYDGVAKYLNIILPNKTLPANVFATYTWYQGSNSQNQIDKDNPTIKPINVGQYTMVYTLVASEINYEIVGTNPITKTFNITPRTITVDFGNVTFRNTNQSDITDAVDNVPVSKRIDLANRETVAVYDLPLVSENVSQRHTLEGYIAPSHNTDGTYSAEKSNLVSDFVIKQGSMLVTDNYNVVFKGKIIIEHKYKILFKANNNLTGATTEEEQNIVYGQGSNLRVNTFAKDGYSFSHWNTSADNSGTSYEAGEFISDPLVLHNQTYTLYAIWERASSSFIIEYYFENIEGTQFEARGSANPTYISEITENYIVLDRGVEYYTVLVYDTQDAFENGDEPIKQYTHTLKFDGFTFVNHQSNVTQGEVTPATSSSGRLVLKVYLTRNSYNVTYTFNNGENPEVRSYKFEEEVNSDNMPPNPSRLGWTFQYWSRILGEEISERFQIPFYMEAKNENIWAEYSANENTEYILQLNYQNRSGEYDSTLTKEITLKGTTDQTVNIEFDTVEGVIQNALLKMTSSDGPILVHTQAGAETGFHLVEYQHNVLSGVINPEFENKLVLVLHYQRNEYTFTRVVKDEETDQDIGLSTNMLHGNTVALPATPLYTGYTFEGWYREESLQNKITTWDFEILQDTTIYANYTPNTNTLYSIKLYQEDMNNSYPENPNLILSGFEATTALTATVNEKVEEGTKYLEVVFTDGETVVGQSQRIPETRFSYYGYQIDKSKPLPQVVISRHGNSVIELYLARFEFEVTLNMEDGATPIQKVSVKYQHTLRDENYTLPNRDNEDDGYTFVGWYYSTNYMLDEKVDIPFVITEDVQLYARWYSNTEIPVSIEFYLQQATNNDITGYPELPQQTLEIRVPLGSFISVENNKILFYRGDTESPTQLIEGLTQDLIIAGYTFYEYKFKNYGTKNGHRIVKSDEIATTTVELKFTLNYHKFTIDKTNETENEDRIVYFGQQPGEILDPTRIGYVFAGWFRNAEATLPFTYSTFTMPDENVTIFAKWDEATNTKYVVEYYHEDLESNPKSYTYIETKEYQNTTNRIVRVSDDNKKIEIRDKTNSTTISSFDIETFIGFTFDATISYNVLQINVEPDGSGVIKLYFTRNQHTLTLENGYSDDDKEYGSKQKTTEIPNIYFNKTTEITNPTRQGYTFDGWYISENLVEPADLEKLEGKSLHTMPDSNVTLYARWKAELVEYIVYYYQENIDDDDFTLLESATQILLGNTGSTVVAEKQVFGGFAYSHTATNENGKQGGIVGAYPQNKLELSLYYVREVYTLSFDGNGATAGFMPTMSFKYEQQKPLIENEFSKTGYTFYGWANNPETVVRAYADKASYRYLGQRDLTLFALWNLKDIDSATLTSSEDVVAYGDQITLTISFEAEQENATIEYGWLFTPKGETIATEISNNSDTLVISQISESGTYSAFVRLILDGKVTPKDTNQVEVEIVKRQIKVNWSSANFDYLARHQAPVPSFALLDLEGYQIEGTKGLTLPAITTNLYSQDNLVTQTITIGSYVAEAIFELNSNFEFVETNQTTYQINKLNWNITIKDSLFLQIYNPAFVQTTFVYSLVNSLTAEEVTIYLERSNTSSEVGFYELYLQDIPSNNDNYNIAINSGNRGFEITPSDEIVSIQLRNLGNLSKVYDGNIIELDPSIFGTSNIERVGNPAEILTFDSLVFEVVNNSKNVGTYSVVLVEAITKEYGAVNLIGTYTFAITQREIGLDLEGYDIEKTYDGQTSINFKGEWLTNILDDDKPHISVNAGFENANAEENKPVIIYGLEGGESSNYKLSAQFDLLVGTIHKRNVKVWADPNTITYGDYDNHTITFTAFMQNLETQEFDQNVSLDIFTGKLQISDDEKVGMYPINIGSLQTNSNYHIDGFELAILTIEKREITLSADNWNKLFDGTDEFVGNLTINGLLQRDIDLPYQLDKKYSQSQPGENIEVVISIVSGLDNYFIDPAKKYYGNIEQVFVTATLDYKTETLLTLGEVTTQTTQLRLVHSALISDFYQALPIPTAVGYNFVGWFAAVGEAEVEITPNSVVDSGIGWGVDQTEKTFYAKWEEAEVNLVVNVILRDSSGPKTYTKDNFEELTQVVVTVNGTELTDNTLTVVNFNHIAEIVATANTNQSLEYIFDGWFFSAVGGGSNQIVNDEVFEIENNKLSINMLNNFEIYVRFTLKADMLTLNMNAFGDRVEIDNNFLNWNIGFEMGQVSTLSKEFDSGTVVALPATLSRTGYSFVGWFNTLEINEGDTALTEVTVIDAVDVYAIWQANTHTATFVANTGKETNTNLKHFDNGHVVSETMAESFTQTMSYRQEFGTLNYQVARARYEFAGWYDNPEFAGTPYTEESIYNFDEDKTFYAKWQEKEFEITFEVKNNQGALIDFARSLDIVSISSEVNENTTIYTVVAKTSATIITYISIKEGYLLQMADYANSEDFDFTLSENQSEITLSRFAKPEIIQLTFAAKLNTIIIENTNALRGSFNVSVQSLLENDLRAEVIGDDYSDRVTTIGNITTIYTFSGEIVVIETVAQNGYMLERISNITEERLEISPSGRVIETEQENTSIYESYISNNILEVVFVERVYEIVVEVGKDLITQEKSSRFGSFAISAIDQDSQKTIIEENTNQANTKSTLQVKTGQKIEIEIFANSGFTISQNQAEYMFLELVDIDNLPSIDFSKLASENIIVIEDILQAFALELVFERQLYTLTTKFALVSANGQIEELSPEENAGSIEFLTAFDGLSGEYYFENNVILEAVVNSAKYTLVGWKETLQGSLLSDLGTFEIAITENKTVYLVVKLNTYTVSYTVVGKGFIEASATNYEIEHGQDVGLVKAQASAGYSFDRWEIFDSLQEIWTVDNANTFAERQDQNITQNLMLRAVFEANLILIEVKTKLIIDEIDGKPVYAEQNVGLISVEGSGEWFTDKQLQSYTDHQIKLLVEVEEGFVFNGWTWDKGLQMQEISNKEYMFSGYTEHFTLEGVFEARQNTVTIGFVKVSEQNPDYNLTLNRLSSGGLVKIVNDKEVWPSSNRAEEIIRTNNSLTFTLSISEGYKLHLNNNQVYIALMDGSGQIVRVLNENIVYNQEENTVEVTIEENTIKSDIVIGLFVELIEYDVNFHIISEEGLIKVETLVLTVESSIISEMQNNELLFPQREGYDFTGWHTTPNLEDQTGLFVDKTGVQRSAWTIDILDIYARWQRKTVIINIAIKPGNYAVEAPMVGFTDDDINYAESNTVDRFGYFIGTEFKNTSILLTAPQERVGYKFHGWFLDGQLVSSDYHLNIILINSQEVFELNYEIVYSVRVYVSSAGHGEAFINGEREVYLVEGQQATLSVLANAGYEFVEWRNETSGASFSFIGETTISYQSVSTILRAIFDGKKVEIIVKESSGGNISEILVNSANNLIEENGKFYAKMDETLNFKVQANIGLRHIGFMVNDLVERLAGYTHRISVEDTEKGSITFEALFEIRPFNYRFIIQPGGTVNLDGREVLNNAVFQTNYFETISFTFWAIQRYAYSEIYIMKDSVKVEIPASNISVSENFVYTVSMPSSLFGVDSENTINIAFEKLLWVDIRQEFEGNGTEKSPYIISTAREFAMMSYLVNNSKNIPVPAGKVAYASAYYKLIAIVDFEDRFWTPIGTEDSPFAGTIWLDYSRYNIHLDKEYDETHHEGLFGNLSKNAKIYLKEVEIKTGLIIISGIVVGLVSISGAFIIVRRVKRKRMFERSISYGNQNRRRKK